MNWAPSEPPPEQVARAIKEAYMRALKAGYLPFSLIPRDGHDNDDTTKGSDE